MIVNNILKAAGYITLSIMVVSGIAFLAGGAVTTWPYLSIFIVATWLHGIVWGYRYAVEGRLTWL